VDLVEHVEEIALGIEADTLDADHDFTDDLLASAGVGAVFEALEVREQRAVDEPENGAQGPGFKFLAFLAARLGPITPAVRLRERCPKRHA
jgi:hypothetical protein